MRKQNFKSDFDFMLRLCDNSGAPVGVPEANWELKLLTTSRQLVYEASYQYGVCDNCVISGDEIRIMIDNHTLPVGELTYEFDIKIPDEAFPDGSRKVCVSGSTDIELVNEDGHQIENAVVKVNVPHLKKKEAEPDPETPTNPEDTSTPSETV